MTMSSLLATWLKRGAMGVVVAAVATAAAATVSRKIRRRLKVVFRVIREVLRVIIRRVIFMRPPARPSWSLLFEMRIVAIRTILNRHRDDRNSMSREERLQFLRQLVPKVRASVDQSMERVPSDVQCTHVKLHNLCDAEWIVREVCQRSERIVFYLHGGGYALCSTRSHKGLLARLGLACDARVFGVNYRLAPEHPFPAAVEDAVMGYTYLLNQGHSPKNIVIAGDSAGGGLSISCVLSLIEQHIPLPAAVCVLSPWVDLKMSHSSWHTNNDTCYLSHDEDLVGPMLYAAETPLDHPLVSPVHASFTPRFPTLLIQVGGAETLLGEAHSLYEKCRKSGVNVELQVYPDMPHVFQAFPSAHYTQIAMAKLSHFVTKHT